MGASARRQQLHGKGGVPLIRVTYQLSGVPTRGHIRTTSHGMRAIPEKHHIINVELLSSCIVRKPQHRELQAHVLAQHHLLVLKDKIHQGGNILATRNLEPRRRTFPSCSRRNARKARGRHRRHVRPGGAAVAMYRHGGKAYTAYEHNKGTEPSPTRTHRQRPGPTRGQRLDTDLKAGKGTDLPRQQAVP